MHALGHCHLIGGQPPLATPAKYSFMEVVMSENKNGGEKQSELRKTNMWFEFMGIPAPHELVNSKYLFGVAC